MQLTVSDNATKLLSIVTLSKLPMNRKDIGSLPYINYNSEFTDMIGLLNALKISALQVRTPYLIYIDYDDPAPKSVILPKNDVGLIYGDFYVINKGFEKKIDVGDWSYEQHLEKPWIIHKPVLNTRKLLSVFKHLPILELDNQNLLYYFVAKIYGAQYVPDLKIVWDKDNSSGVLHKKAFTLRDKTIEFIKDHGQQIENNIRNDSQFYELFSTD